VASELVSVYLFLFFVSFASFGFFDFFDSFPFFSLGQRSLWLTLLGLPGPIVSEGFET